MGDRTPYQPLTRHDRVTVILYRAGIVLSTASVAAAAAAGADVLRLAPLLLFVLLASVGLSVFFIHLYMSSFHRALKKGYAAAALAFAALLVLGRGDPSAPLAGGAGYGPLLLIPLALCLGFITAKEAFCFQLFEGYLVAVIMPIFLLAMAAGLLGGAALRTGGLLIAGLLVLFTLRKVFQPLHYDIGDKSAYR